MSGKTQQLVSAIVVSSLVSTAVNFATPAMAQRVSPRMALSAGSVFKSFMKPLAKGALGAVGSHAANQVIEGGKTAQASPTPQIFIFMQYVRMPNGAVYKVCQQVQNGNYSYPYYC